MGSLVQAMEQPFEQEVQFDTEEAQLELVVLQVEEHSAEQVLVEVAAENSGAPDTVELVVQP